MLVEPKDCYMLYNDSGPIYSKLTDLLDWSGCTLASAVGRPGWDWCSSEQERFVRFYVNRIPHVMGFIRMQNPEVYDDEDVGLGFYNAETNCTEYSQMPGFATTADIAKLTPQKFTNYLYRNRNMVYDCISKTRGHSFARLESRVPNILYSSDKTLPQRFTKNTRQSIHKRMMGDVLLQMIRANWDFRDAADEVCRYYVRHYDGFFARFVGDTSLVNDPEQLQKELYDVVTDDIEDDDGNFWGWYGEEAESIELLFTDL